MPAERTAALQRFLDRTTAAIAARTGTDTPAAQAMRRVGAAIAAPRPRLDPPAPVQLPACGHLARALELAGRGPADIAGLAGAIEALAPAIAWRHRPNDDPIFTAGHANASILGPEPNALEPRPDVRIGISLMAPGITYPDHHHPPEEVYIVLSAGDWRQGAASWHAPGVGGIVYNPPHILHAMRSHAEPLLAVWCLPVSDQSPPARQS